MRRRAGVLLAAAALAAGGCGGAGDDLAPSPQEAVTATAERVTTTPERRVRQPPLRPGQFSAKLTRPVWVRSRPSGRVLRSLGTRTKFGSRTALAVVARRGAWLGVLTEGAANGRTSWIPASAARLERQAYTIKLDRSRRLLAVRRGETTVRAFRVAVGRPGTPTPVGRAGVTDTLFFPSPGAYGCCAVALTFHQTNLPESWTGAPQVAIHGTPDESVIGRAVSLGCVRTRNGDISWMARNIPAGALVTVVP